MGMIHSGHRTSDVYGIDDIQEMVRVVNPDVILVEIPPGRLAIALDEYREAGSITEPRVRVFPEYVDAIIPLQAELGFDMIPCAGWSKAMADDRRQKLKRWETERPAETAEVNHAMKVAEQRTTAGGDDDPAWIHTDAYDDIVREGMEPYNRLFNDDLGAGGWDNINAAHYALIAEYLDAHSGEGLRVLITFGSWHKYWFLDQLRQRDDVIAIQGIGD